jgi:hypothetical protein
MSELSALGEGQKSECASGEARGRRGVGPIKLNKGDRDTFPDPLRLLLFIKRLLPNLNAKSRSAEFNAWPTMVVVVSIAVVHVEAVTYLDTTRSAEAFVAHLTTDAFRAGGNCK